MRRLVAAGLIASAACGMGKPRPPMTDAERLYRAKCTSCHSAYEPADYPPQKWPVLIAEMEKAKRVHLANEDRAIILGYLMGNPGMAAY